MPYIPQKNRDTLSTFVKMASELTDVGRACDNAGELNYTFTKIIFGYIDRHGKRYQNFNDVVGALEGAKLELYRRQIADYEETKIEENGDV